ncbi:MAG TPA: adenylate/guanylate cyclase domain-containing protein [Candidatus Binatia bacterium]|nr:adenylate/guanylate cyclase domain-containing protein [Candidatus Binatia bacterium]
MIANSFDVVALIAVGMGVAFWITDPDSPTSRALALFLLCTGVAIGINARAVQLDDLAQLPWWVRVVGLMEALAFITGVEWGLRVGRTITAEHQRGFGIALLRAAQVLTLIYAALAAAFPRERAHDLLGSLTLHRVPGPWFFAFAGPAVLAGLLVVVAGVRVLFLRPDRAEVVRIGAMLGAMPLLAGAVALPPEIAPFSIALGEIVFLLGALRYHVVQGARGQFMARFLAPQVAELVRERGLKNAMARQRVTLSIVCCDIRGFTAYAQDHTPEQVMKLLRDFYGAIGAAATAEGGTIKDLAGDGALILIGAPVPFADHAARALSLARRLQATVRPVVKKRSERLGLGVGVASGKVAVGIVGQGARYEYVAVGPTVNLASRLCDEARDGEIHAAETTLVAAGEKSTGGRRRHTVKGIAEPVTAVVIA